MGSLKIRLAFGVSRSCGGGRIRSGIKDSTAGAVFKAREAEKGGFFEKSLDNRATMLYNNTLE